MELSGLGLGRAPGVWSYGGGLGVWEEIKNGNKSLTRFGGVSRVLLPLGNA